MGATINTETIGLFKNDWLLLSDFIDMWCAESIGTGTQRDVYQFRYNKSLVVKIDKTNGVYFANVAEWDIWTQAKENKDISKWLAPCVQISNAGKVMLQVKTTPIKDISLLPKKIPAFLCDTKIQNWGMLKGVPVCHDYANNRLFSTGTKTGLIKAEWWSDHVSAPIKYAKNIKQ